jgi:hypothetical protein
MLFCWPSGDGFFSHASFVLSAGDAVPVPTADTAKPTEVLETSVSADESGVLGGSLSTSTDLMQASPSRGRFSSKIRKGTAGAGPISKATKAGVAKVVHSAFDTMALPIPQLKEEWVSKAMQKLVVTVVEGRSLSARHAVVSIECEGSVFVTSPPLPGPDPLWTKPHGECVQLISIVYRFGCCFYFHQIRFDLNCVL